MKESKFVQISLIGPSLTRSNFAQSSLIRSHNSLVRESTNLIRTGDFVQYFYRLAVCKTRNSETARKIDIFVKENNAFYYPFYSNYLIKVS